MSDSLDQEIRTLQSIFWSERDPEGLAFASLADAFRRKGDVREALDLLTDGMSRHPDYATGHVIATRLYLDQGMTSEAEISARRVLQLDAENLVALSALTTVLAEKGELEEAARHRTLLRSVDPQSEEARAVAALDLEASDAEAPALEEIRSAGDVETRDVEIGDVAEAAQPAEITDFEVDRAVGSEESESLLGDLTLEPLPETGTEPDEEELSAAMDSLGLAEGADADEPLAASDAEIAELEADLPGPEVELPDLDAIGMDEPIEEVGEATDFRGEIPEPDEAEATADEELMDLTALAPDGPEAVVDMADLAPDEPEPVVHMADLAPDEPEPVVDMADLAPDEPEFEVEVVELAALAPDELETVIDMAALAPDELETVVDMAALAPDEPEPVVDMADLAPDEPEPVFDMADLAPDEPELEVEVVDLAALAPDEPEAVVDMADLAPDEPDLEGDVVELAALVPDEPEVGTEVPDLAPAQGEAGSDLPTEDDEAVSEPIYTRTLADLYIRQGFTDKALEVLNALYEMNPHATDLADRIRALEKGELDDLAAPPQPPASSTPSPGGTVGDGHSEHEVETRAKELAEQGLEDADEVDTPFAWREQDETTESDTDEDGEPAVGGYFDRLLAWEDRDEP